MSEGDAERHTFLKAGHRSVDPVILTNDELKRIFALPPCWLHTCEISKPRKSLCDRLWHWLRGMRC